MKNHTVRRIVALSLGATLLLSACGNSDDAAPSPSASTSTDSTAIVPPTTQDIAAINAITWAGGGETPPTLTFTTPLSVTTGVSRVVTEGTGEAPTDASKAWLRTVAYDASTGEEMTAGTDTWAAPQMIDFTTAPEGHALLAVLKDKKIGTRAIYIDPINMGDGTTMTAITAFEIVATPPVLSLDEGMPTVTFDESGVPAITLTPGFSGPTDLITQVLTEGTGAVVESGQTVSVNYSGWLLSTGAMFDSSWVTGTPLEVAPIGAGKVIAGWDQGLIGQRVGSTLVLVIPSDLAYGDQGNTSIPGGSDLVFVVEILSAS